MKVTKACLLVAGRGTRLAPLTDTKPKPLIPVANKPMLDYMVEALASNGIQEVLLIVGYKKERIIAHYKDGTEFGVKITYTEQKEFLGTGHAANLASEFAQGRPILLAYGDLFVGPDMVGQVLASFEGREVSGLIAGRHVNDPEKYGILKVDAAGHLEEIIEKPPDARYGTLINAGIYILPPEVFPTLDTLPKSPRGEYELTDALTALAKARQTIAVEDVGTHYWSDLGHPWQLMDATKEVIARLPGPPCTKAELPPAKVIDHGATIENFVTIHGTVEIGKGTIIKSGTYIEGPVIIGKHCQIGPNAYLRPYSAIGDGSKVGNASEVKASIIMDHSAIPHLSYVGDSIIGSHVNFGCGSITANLRLDKQNIKVAIKGMPVDTDRHKLGAIVGDYASLGIQVSIMPGKKIGANVWVGSNTVVSEDIPSDMIHHVAQSTKTTKKRVS